MKCLKCGAEAASGKEYCGKGGERYSADESLRKASWMREDGLGTVQERSVVRVKTPYVTKSWSSSQVKKSAALLTILTIPMVLFFILLAALAASGIVSVILAIVSVFFVLLVIGSWMQVRSIDNRLYEEQTDHK